MIEWAAVSSGATVLARHHHRFEPHGVSALCFLAESHISIHTWPETGTATVDVYTCGESTDPERACAAIIERLAPGRHDLEVVQRGCMTPPAPSR
jgi:S-adenosylmethionine decarboxylase proenzyme